MTRPDTLRHSGFYVVALIGWIAMTVLALYVAGDAATRDTEARFRSHAAEIAADFRQKLHDNEAVLSAFAAFLSAVEGGDRAAAVRFARSMLASYEHVYMLEVARRVGVDEVPAFEKTLRGAWQSDFRIKSFDYAARRDFSGVPAKTAYWPLIFLYPDFSEARSVYGLDLDSIPHLAPALDLALRRRGIVSTPPFKLIEGDAAYVLYQAVERSRERRGSGAFDGELVALLVVKTLSLAPRWIEPQVGFSARMTIAPGEPGSIVEQSAKPAHWLEASLLPKLSMVLDSGHTAQPVRLSFERQIRWADLSGLGLRAVAVISLLSLALVVLYLRRHHLATMRADEEHERAEYLATHDALTRLPNRTLLADRVRQAQMRRHRFGSMFALFLVDLDHFKDINDQFGHEGGDAVLVGVGRRISETLRGIDTVARYGGDEFIILIVDVPDESDAMAVAEKLLHAVGQPIDYEGQPVTVTCSVGVALCPRDGETLEQLSRHADHAMYRVKAGGRNAVSAFAGDD